MGNNRRKVTGSTHKVSCYLCFQSGYSKLFRMARLNLVIFFSAMLLLMPNKRTHCLQKKARKEREVTQKLL